MRPLFARMCELWFGAEAASSSETSGSGSGFALVFDRELALPLGFAGGADGGSSFSFSTTSKMFGKHQKLGLRRKLPWRGFNHYQLCTSW